VRVRVRVRVRVLASALMGSYVCFVCA
jgi:hypothetical protein